VILLLACDWSWWLGSPSVWWEADSGLAQPTAGCLPQAWVAEEHVLEGEPVVVTVACASGIDASFSIGDRSGTWEGSQFTWVTGLASAGRHEIQVWAEREGTWPETVVATVHVVDAVEHPDNEPVDPLTYELEWGVPVLHLEAHEELDQHYGPATLHYRGEAHEAEMKIRGATSSHYPKPGYTLRFAEDLDFGEDGLPVKDHLVLTTLFDDNSYVRQKLVYDTWLALGEGRLGVHSFFAVVYLDGEYEGLFLAMERVDDELADALGWDRDGNLYKAVTWDANFYRYGTSGEVKETLHDGYEKKEGKPVEGEDGAFDDLEELVAFVADSRTDAFFEEADERLALDEFVDWYVLTRAVAGDDSIGKNAYLYNDPTDPRFHYAPWDFNHSYGQDWHTKRVDPDDWEDYTVDNGVFAHLLETGRCDRRLEEALRGPLSAEQQLGRIEGYLATMERSAARDWTVWSEAYATYEGWADIRDDLTSFEEEVAYVQAWIAAREVVLQQAAAE